MDWLLSIVVLAQQQAEGADDGQSFWFNMIPMALIAILAYFMLIVPEKKKQEHLQKLGGVKEKDRILTTGGIYGVVTNVQRDAGRVTIRVDEATGTKIKISLSAVAQILGDDDSQGKDIAKDKS